MREEKQTPAARGDPADTVTVTPERLFEARKDMTMIVSQYTQTLRQSALGEYRDPHTIGDADLRINFTVNQHLKQMTSALQVTVPDFDSDEYADRLAVCISEMRGRELPGLGSTRMLLATLSSELDEWRQVVEDCIADCFESYQTAGEKLAYKYVTQYPKLLHRFIEVLREVCSTQLAQASRRVEEMFMRDPSSSSSSYADTELVECINQVRFARFEKALREVLIVAREGTPVIAGAAAGNGSGPGAGSGSGSGSVTGNIGESGGTMEGGSSKEDLKLHMMEMLGPIYMSYHSIQPHSLASSSGSGAGASKISQTSLNLRMQLEDGRAALKAYWKYSEGRINEDVAMVVSMQLLRQCSKEVERHLLEETQQWLCGEGEEVTDMMSASPHGTTGRPNLDTYI